MLVDLFDIARFFIFCLVMTIGVFFIILLYNVNQFVKKANRVVEENSQNVYKTLYMLTDTMNNVNDITLSVKESIDKAGNAVESIGGTISETAATFNEGTGNLVEFVKIVSGVIRVVLGMFSKD